MLNNGSRGWKVNVEGTGVSSTGVTVSPGPTESRKEPPSPPWAKTPTETIPSLYRHLTLRIFSKLKE